MHRPVAPHPFSMTVRDCLFVHWPFDPERIRPHVPDPLELDVYDGRAWISVLPFVLSDAGVRFSPSVARLTFPELNVRTYVRFDDAPGLYFLSIDVGHPLVAAVVNRASRLPCYAAEMDVRTRTDGIDFRSVRRRGGDPPVRFEAVYRPDGAVFGATPGTVDYWLTERRRMYDPVGEGVLYAEIAHDPWPLQPADVTIHAETVFEGSGLPTPRREPRVHYSGRRTVTGSVPRRIRTQDGDPRVRPNRLAQR